MKKHVRNLEVLLRSKKKKKKTGLKKQHMISTILHSAKVKTNGEGKDIGDCQRLWGEEKSKRFRRGT